MKLTDGDILAAISAAETMAFGPQTSEIASDRADALDRYLGKPYGDEQAGRSKVVSRDISDVVEGVTANVLKPFIGGDRVVTFNPRGPEDEAAAQQETDYVNFVVMERNNGFVVLTSGIKDALLLRNGYLKCGWTKRDDITIETYQGMSDEELAMLMKDEDVEIVAHTEYPDPYAQGAQMIAPPQTQVPGSPGAPMGGPPAPIPMLHDVRVHRKYPTEYVEIFPAPPDEILVSQRGVEPSVQNSDFVQHRTHKTLSELRELGYDVPDDIIDDDDNSETVEDFARAQFTSQADMWADPTQTMARRLVLYKETWIRLDVDGDGIAELRRVCQVGQNILTYKKSEYYKGGEQANEPADLIPIACFTPVLMPHRHLGISVYDLVKDIAEIKTAMLRSHLDNRYLLNNAEKVVNADVVENMDDFLTSRPGGLKRVKGDPAAAVMPLVVPDTGAGALQTLEYLDSIRENRTGYTKTAEGMASDSLETDTLGEYQQQISQSGLRLEMIARTIAETGLRDLFRIVHALTLKHSTRAEKIRLRNQWVAVDPREWVRRTDLSISVGLGSTNGPQQIQNLMMIGQAQQQAMPLGIVTPDNIYNTLSKLAIAAGFKNPDEFFTNPQGKPPPQQPNPMVQAEQVKGQAQIQMAQMKAQTDQQIAGAKAQADAQVQAARAQADMAIQQHKIQTDAALQLEQTKQQLALDDLRHSREQQTAIEIAKINAEAKVAAANVMAVKQADAQAQAALDRDVG